MVIAPESNGTKRTDRPGLAVGPGLECNFSVRSRDRGDYSTSRPRTWVTSVGPVLAKGIRMSRSVLEIGVKNLEFARGYSSHLIADIQADEWFCQPAGLPTHLAWQVGHLAMAQYGLTMIRLRGK